MMRYTILHVEDDPNDVLLVQRAFRKASLPAFLEAVHDGDKAVAYLIGEGIYKDRERYPLPSLLLLDLKIPRKSGLELLSWIRVHPEFKRLPVTILTSSRHERDINQAYETGANSYLVKPVGFDALVDMVKLINAYWIHLNEKPGL
jgi:CheY-like chemotaxis protein